LGRLAPRLGETELRSLLGCFLFQGEDVFKRIGVLSGGERGRYALLRLLLYPANFLLLDEPTNHLDLRAKDVLLEALAKYTGTVVFVSHDRYFIDKLATRIFEVADGQITVFPGNYEDYLWRKQGGQAAIPTLEDVPMSGSSPRQANRKAASESAALPAGGNGSPSPGAISEDSVKGRRLNPIKRKQMEDRVHELEEAIARVEAAVSQCEAGLLTFVSAGETQRQTKELEGRRSELAALMNEWEELAQTLQTPD